MIDLSIIIVNWNTRKLLIDCVKSIYQYPPNVNFEIIVVDNGSNDDSIKHLVKLKLKNNYNIRIIKNSENLGFSKANNQAIKKANGKSVLLLNSDTKVTTNALTKLLEFVSKEKDIGVVGARLLNADGSIQPSCFNFPTLKNAFLEYWFGKVGIYSKYYPRINKPIAVDVVVGACFLITPKALEKVGLLNEDYFFFYEDLDYCRRVWKKRLKVYYLPESIVYHFHGASVDKPAMKNDTWKRLIPGSKKYNGVFKHYVLFLIILSSQKFLGKRS